MKEKVIRYRMFSCIFAFIAVFFLCFSVYLFRQQRRSNYKTMEDMNKSVINTVRENFSLLNDSALKMIANIQTSAVGARMIYQAEEDYNRHAMDFKQLYDSMLMIPEFDSAVTYNNKTKVFEYFHGEKNKFSEISDNIIYGGKSCVSYVPYFGIIGSGKKDTEYVITYYAYDYISENIMNGVIAVNIKTDFIAKAAKNLGVEDFKLYICDSKGKIYYSLTEKSSYQRTIDSKLMKRIMTGKGFTQKIGHERHYISSEQLPASDYIIVCELPQTAAAVNYKKNIRIFIVMFMLLLACIAAAFFITKILTRYIKKPLSDFVRSYTGSDDSRDVFEKISEILNDSEANTIQMIEMKKTMDGIKLQNDIKALLYGETKILNDEEYALIDEIFGRAVLIGAEFLFENTVDVNGFEKRCNDAANGEADCYFVRLRFNSVLVLFKNAAAEKVKSIAEKVQIQEDGSKASVFISREYGLESFSEMYKELELMEKQELKYSKGCLLTSDIICENSEKKAEFEYPKTEENKLINAVSAGDISAIKNAFDEFLGKIILYDVNDERAAIMRVAFAIQNSYENRRNRDDNVYKQIVAVVGALAGFETMSDVYERFDELFLLCVDSDTQKNKSGQSAVTARVIACIDEEYGNENLNLDMIADKLHLSTNYVGRLFRKETGKSVSKYLVEYRLKKAVELMNDSSISMKSVIDKIGFVSESNFYKQFKKYYGVTPSEYREIKK